MVLGCAAEVSPRRSSGGGTPGMAFWPPEWTTRPYSVRKRKRGVGKCSPRLGFEQCGGAGRSATRTGGGGGAELAEELTQGDSGLLVSMVRRVVVLRRNHGGQGGPKCFGGVESPWRSELT